MARSKSKHRSNSTNDSASSTRAPSRIKQAETVRARQDRTAEIEAQDDSGSSALVDASVTPSVGLLPLENQVEPILVSRHSETLSSEVDYFIKSSEIESALEQVNHWLNEATETQSLEALDQKLEQTSDTGLSSELESVLPDYRQELVPDTTGHAGELNNLLNFENSTLSHSSMAIVDLDGLCQRLEATTATIEARLEQVMESFESKLNDRYSQLLDSLNHLPNLFQENATSEILRDLTAKPHPMESAQLDSTWESRKRQLLSDFGMSTEEIEQQVPKGKPSKSGENSKLQAKVETSSFEALQNSIETLDKIDSGFHSEEIERLKEQLTAQLREAEIELSINRARLSKEWAALEQRTSELNQRESALKSKYHDVDSSSKHGLLDRITRHLSRKS